MIVDDTINIIDWDGCESMDREKFLRLAMLDLRPRLIESFDDPKYRTTGMVCFQDERGHSSTWGDRHFVLYGPDRTRKTAAEALMSMPGHTAIAQHERKESKT